MGTGKLATDFVSSNWRLLSIFNVIFFSVALGTGLGVGSLLPLQFYSGQRVYTLPQFLYGSLPLMFLFLFCFNLAISAFAVVTLPGFLFFPLSGALLMFRAVLWGLMLHPLPTTLFLIALPTLVLEGEAYVFAATMGTAVGYSWLRRPEGARREAFVDACERDTVAYVFVVLLLLAAALVESETIMLVQM